MIAKNDGGPAFPCEGFAAQHAPGMTLRDWFAGQVLAESSIINGDNPEHAAKTAHRAYAIADAMIAERKK